MSDQFNISSIPGFSISQIEPSDLSTVLDCMNEIYRELPEKSWFSMDEREDLIRYMTVSGFGLKAEAVATDGAKDLAAVFVARTSDLGDENLGSYLEPDDSQLSLVAHMEIAMVQCLSWQWITKETNGSRRRAASFCRFSLADGNRTSG